MRFQYVDFRSILRTMWLKEIQSLKYFIFRVRKYYLQFWYTILKFNSPIEPQKHTPRLDKGICEWIDLWKPDIFARPSIAVFQESFTAKPIQIFMTIIFKSLHKNTKCSKLMRVLTRTECSCSDDRLPICYLLRNFRQILSYFFDSLRFASLQFIKIGERGSTRRGTPALS